MPEIGTAEVHGHLGGSDNSPGIDSAVVDIVQGHTDLFIAIEHGSEGGHHALVFRQQPGV